MPDRSFSSNELDKVSPSTDEMVSSRFPDKSSPSAPVGELARPDAVEDDVGSTIVSSSLASGEARIKSSGGASKAMGNPNSSTSS